MSIGTEHETHLHYMLDPDWREQVLANKQILRSSFRQVVEEIAAETSGEIR